MLFRQIFDPALAQYAYLLGCQRTGEALVIDPERDVDRYLDLAAAEGLELVAVAETHIHADFLSGARELAARGLRAYLSDEGGEDWRYEWASEEGVDCVLLEDGDTFRVGGIELRARHTPGHTPEHLSFLVTDRGSGADLPLGLISGDFVFVGSLGRPDLLETAAGQVGAQEPSARRLFRSASALGDLGDHLQLWPAHGAGSACGKALGAVPMSTMGYERQTNAALATVQEGEQAFVDWILSGQPEPPLYFATMKRLNKVGPPVLGGLPRPERLDRAGIESAARSEGAVILDTREDRQAFMNGHLEGSLYAPLGRSFPTSAGSILGADQRIYLVIDPDQLDTAVRHLIRIGLDRIEGYLPAAELAGADGLAKIESGDFQRVSELSHRYDHTVLDVRGATEHQAASIPASLNIAHTRLAARLEELPEGHTLLVHCLSGARAAIASALLAARGHNVLYVDDHFDNRQLEQAAGA